MGGWGGKGRQRRWVALGGVLGCFCAVCRPGGATALETPGCLAGGTPVKVTAISDKLELALDDGRTVLLPGIDPIRATSTQPDGVRRAQSVLGRWLVGRTVTVNPRAAEPDRWGRTVAVVLADPPDAAGPSGAAVSVAEAMLDAGFARAKADPQIASCWPRYRSLEADARAATLGLWGDRTYAVVQAGATEQLAERAGTMAIVEGRVASIRTGRTRFYLALDDKGRSGFSIAVERRIAAGFQKTGADVNTWTGKRIRVRGFLDDRFGLQIDLTTLDQVEFIDP